MSKLLLQALKGRPSRRPEGALANRPPEGAQTKLRRPLWIMRQAGRYLPEYRALRADHSFEELSGSPALAAEVTLLPFQHFHLDAAIIFADLMSPVPALGLSVRFDPGPVLDRTLRSSAEIHALPDADPGEIAPGVIDTLRRVKPRLPEGVALLGFAGAPMTVAAYLVQGRGQRDFPRLRALAAEDPKAFETLMAKLARLSAAYLIEQARAGADAVQVFDSWGGLLSRDDWQRLVRPHLADLLEEVGRAGVPRILFFQNGAHLLDLLLELPAEGFSLDWRLDLAEVRRKGATCALQGNMVHAEEP